MTLPGVACVGAGHWGRNLVRNFRDLGVLRSVCDTDAGCLDGIVQLYPDIPLRRDVGEVLADPTVAAVAIATPAETHGGLVRRALEAGKDVFVEKPLCLDVAEARALVAMAEEAGRILMLGHVLWYHPAVVRLSQLVADGELGRIQYLYSNRLNLGRIRREENILWSFAPHDISVILGLVGEMPNEVVAMGSSYLHRSIADVTLTHLSFPSGVRAHVFVSWLHPFKEQKLVVVGERGMAVFDDTSKDRKLLMYPHAIEWKANVPVARKADAQVVEVDGTEPLALECRAFLDAVSTRRPPRTDGREGVRVLEVLDRAQRSMDGGGSGARPEGGRRAGDAERSGAQVHPSAVVDRDVAIGPGSRIWHFSHVLEGSRIGRDARIGQNVVIGPRVTIGDNVKIQNNVSVYEGVTLEDDVFCGPSLVFTNVHNPRSEIPRMDELRATLVRRGATLGANATILCGTTIGRWAFVGAGAVVVRDVPDFALVVGNPARRIGWMCRCGERVAMEGEAGSCAGCGRAFRDVGGILREEDGEDPDSGDLAVS